MTDRLPPPDDRHEDRGRDSREPDSWLTKNLQAVLVFGGLGIFGGGGAWGGSTLSGKLDDANKQAVETNKKIDALTLALTELKGQVFASSKESARQDAVIAVLGARVADLDRAAATNGEKLAEHERRLTSLESRK